MPCVAIGGGIESGKENELRRVFASVESLSEFAGSVAAANITGTISLAQLPGELVTNGASGVNLSGNLAGTFSGNGAGLTGVDLRTANSLGAIAFTTNRDGDLEPADAQFQEHRGAEHLRAHARGAVADALLDRARGAPSPRRRRGAPSPAAAPG